MIPRAVEDIGSVRSRLPDALRPLWDGGERSDGLLLFVTTNFPDKVDPALSIKGRMDRIIEFDVLPEEGRCKLANRILAEYPDDIMSTVKAGDGDTGASFERRCIEIATRRYYEAAQAKAG